MYTCMSIAFGIVAIKATHPTCIGLGEEDVKRISTYLLATNGFVPDLRLIPTSKMFFHRVQQLIPFMAPNHTINAFILEASLNLNICINSTKTNLTILL